MKLWIGICIATVDSVAYNERGFHMLVRILTGVVIFLLLIPTVLFSNTPFLPALTTALTAIGIYEMVDCKGWRKEFVAIIPAVFVGGGMQWAARYANDALEVICCLIIALIGWELICAVFSKRNFDSTKALSVVGLVVYISFGFASLILLRDTKGMAVLPLAFLLPWGCDTMAYFGGRLFGKHKLIPEVSPKKTVEGAISGSIGAAVIAVLYGLLIDSLTKAEAHYILLAFSGLFVSVLSQCGDLIMSLIKREHGIKDYGTIFPGHGGVLDRFDSILIAAPTLYFIGYFVGELQFFA